MASILFRSSSGVTPVITSFNPTQMAPSPAVNFSGETRRRRRRLAVVTRAGPPSTNSYIFAFVFPMSLLVGTIFTSIKIGEKLDRDYLEELAINQSIMEAEEEDGNDDDDDHDKVEILLEEKMKQPVLQPTRTRNRPKREA
ncbi:high chlorophyll fluorescence 153 [Euphorbia peplus]|nr:high chlorophyll fluorescence 153 [Euphorbia peplus]